MIAQAPHATDYDRIADAVQFIQANWRSQPTLQQIAKAAHMSEFHFQRLFTRWVGISPKRYCQFLTLDRARTMLREPRSLLDATLDLGLSAPSRLHDLFVTIEAVTPGEYKLGGAGLRIDYGHRACPFGRCFIGMTDRGVCWLSFFDGDCENESLTALRETWPGAMLKRNQTRAQEMVENIFTRVPRTNGQRVKLLVRGTNFQLKVWEALVRLPAGQVISYEQLAAAIGLQRAARAVGNAVAGNHIAYLIPCHRVIRSTGHTGQYRWGSTRKQAMLTWETARESSGYARPAGIEERD